ncbi:unnamed protein product [Menidia menidia]|uniref:(Atlantic silverside) hypothetical protein n=1 Tax=Menidia menidia TaxID=238744 RepID=A0A8S4AEV7_9TELE|nr:unnamed protein product [Menidia menidia]
MAVLVDLLHGCWAARNGASLLGESHQRLFLLCGRGCPQGSASTDSFLTSFRDAQVLDSGSTAENLYRLKQAVDRLDLSSVTVLTSRRGREVLGHYQELLFTAVYTFDYKVMPVEKLTCPSCAGPAHTGSPGEGIPAEVAAFAQKLPTLRGEIRVLNTRAGGVTCIPTLSSLNLFKSSKRRDPEAVVTENRRRLALHAGFHPLPLRLVKVNHASDVWVLGKAEPESYDAMVTDRRGLVLAAPGADCMPILFADPVKKVIGAAHADFGCRAEDVVVAVGPAVGPCCFRLDREQARDFSSIHPDCVPDPEVARPHVDIRLANRILLQNGGVRPEHIHDHTVTDRPCVTPCTSCHPEDFFSHVRDGINFGTQVGFLWMD